MKAFYNILKRVFDLVFGLIGFLILSPIFLLIACAVKLDSKGPIFFKQARLGRKGKPYYIYKFRSMVVNAENIGTGLFNYKDDPRVTRVGNFLRNTSLDELPQFINIIKGNMSFVGPRPPVTYELGNYKDFDDRLKSRFDVKPGVTGLAQVSGRNELSWDEKIKYDLKYIQGFYRWGLLLDIRIIFQTLIKVIKMEGSHELEENAQEDLARQKK
jgi:lipopolysaccharide/colanic/teichoic acid biosynthesis glycosyltransferase